jgi:hypothetical protein
MQDRVDAASDCDGDAEECRVLKLPSHNGRGVVGTSKEVSALATLAPPQLVESIPTKGIRTDIGLRLGPIAPQ